MNDEPEIIRDPTPREVTLEVAAETLEVSKRIVPGDVVRVTKQVEERDVEIDEVLSSRSVTVERRPVSRELDEGERVTVTELDDGTLIVPVVEEQLVVIKRRVVVEEIVLRPIERRREVSRTLTLRRERVDVERDEADSQAG